MMQSCRVHQISQTHGACPQPRVLVGALGRLDYAVSEELAERVLASICAPYGSQAMAKVFPELERAGLAFAFSSGKSVLSSLAEPELPERDLVLSPSGQRHGAIRVSLKQGPGSFYVTLTYETMAGRAQPTTYAAGV